ncbi:hypothetical protein LUZ63_011027 [Rhynchospora breviuscula]|uniref:Uncharacterized protein n=1 Tax=Rhynchospora breviuscula TaxID=2022672 RepID=A0A9Q0CHZ4_9POAL|nr:hypothetical protein LUZ63_011027 [Rhynchospora breviuscula]
MDQAVLEANRCNGIKNSIGLNCKGEGEEERETVSLLPQVVKGDVGEIEKRNSRRKVQWNDRNGNSLVEILEFQPSDSSESEGEEEDGACCNCSIM